MEPKKKVPDFPINIGIGFYEGFFNLHCPKCPVHGENKDHNLIEGTMSLEKACKLFDELEGLDGIIAVGRFTEPL
jgi:hypothetical protein